MKDKEKARKILQKLLLLSKTSTIGTIYERIAPAQDGRIHSEQSPYGTETTRFSHSETFLFNPGSTNLANLPKKMASLDSLYAVRDCIIADKGRILCKGDYSQAEARWCAYLAGDSKRIKMFEEGLDQYKIYVAVLKWDDESKAGEVSKIERQAIGKEGVLAGQYKASWKTLQARVNFNADLTGVAINAKTAKKMEAIWPELFPETVQWWQEVREEVLTKGVLRNHFGFKRHFFGRRDSSYAEDAVVREAIAFGPQSANAWMLNLGLRELYEKYDPKLLRILLQVHDEIVFDCLPQELARAAKIVKETMEKPQEVKGRVMLIPAEVERCQKSWSQSKRIA